MPLDRRHVTVASRVMLPTYPVLAGGLGIGFLLTPEAELLKTPIYRSMDMLMPLGFWGAGLFVMALAQVAALLVNRRPVYVASLSIMIVWMAAWAGVDVWSFTQDEASPFAWLWPAFAARCCWASMQSLLAGER